MDIQSFVFPGGVCSETELFYRGETAAEISASKDSDYLILDRDSVLSSDTYMNFFDKTFWRRYTCVSKVELAVQLTGAGVVELYENESLTQTIPFQFTSPTEASLLPDMQTDGYCYFKIRAKENSELYQAVYRTDKQAPREVKLAILICTYNREAILKENLGRLRGSLFFEKGSAYFGNLFLYVTDNAATLQKEDLIGVDSASPSMADHLSLKHSKNLGGSGGFTNCILEMRKNHDRFPATHVVFMDDDALFIPETFYRLYALLSYMRPEYEKEVIAGRMFRMDQKNIQYTASEVWNKGDLIHKGFQEDMCKKENIIACNEERGEYAGWWFAVYPYAFAAENLPLPFFLHCDDVEYGLRHKGSPLVLNGIQVWHDTYEYRISPVITYYDLRNSMTVNALYGLLPDKETFLAEWKERLAKRQEAGEHLEEYMQILAMRDFLKGNRYFLRRNIRKEHELLCQTEKEPPENLENSRLCSLAETKILHSYENIVKTYQQQED